MSKEWLTQKEIDSLRVNQEDFMPGRLRIERQFYMGDGVFEPATEAADVACRITPGFGYWRQVADRFQGITAFVITVPWDTEILPGDTVYDAYSRKFEIRDVRAPSSWQTAKQTLADMVTES